MKFVNQINKFDIIVDIHVYFNELINLIQKLNYKVYREEGNYILSHVEKRKLVFLVDLVNKGSELYLS